VIAGHLPKNLALYFSVFLIVATVSSKKLAAVVASNFVVRALTFHFSLAENPIRPITKNAEVTGWDQVFVTVFVWPITN